jgi:hypothetical protein
VLNRANSFVKTRLIVAGQDRDGFLGDDRAAVEGCVDDVDGHAGDRGAMGERISDGVGSRERGQERGMRVEDPTGIRLEDGRADDPHVACQRDRIGPGTREGFSEGRIGAGVDDAGRDALLRGPIDRRARSIGEDEHDLRAELSAGCRSVERPEVGTPARHPDGNAAAHCSAPSA